MSNDRIYNKIVFLEYLDIFITKKVRKMAEHQGQLFVHRFSKILVCSLLKDVNVSFKTDMYMKGTQIIQSLHNKTN